MEEKLSKHVTLHGDECDMFLFLFQSPQKIFLYLNSTKSTHLQLAGKKSRFTVFVHSDKI